MDSIRAGSAGVAGTLAVSILAVGAAATTAEALEDGDLLVADGTGDAVIRVDPTGGPPEVFAEIGVDDALGLAVATDGRVVVANLKETAGIIETELATFNAGGDLLCVDAVALAGERILDIDFGGDGKLYAVGAGGLWELEVFDGLSPEPGCLNFFAEQVADLGATTGGSLDVVETDAGDEVDFFRVAAGESGSILSIEPDGGVTSVDLSVAGLGGRDVVGVDSRAGGGFWVTEQGETGFPVFACDTDLGALAFVDAALLFPVADRVWEGDPVRCPGGVAGDTRNRAYLVETLRANLTTLEPHVVRVERASDTAPWTASRVTTLPLTDPFDIEIVRLSEPGERLAGAAAVASLALLAWTRRRSRRCS